MMVSADQIRDEVTLRGWLAGRPRADALEIAYRAALRELPTLISEIETYKHRQTNWTVLPALLCVLTLGASVYAPDRGLSETENTAAAMLRKLREPFADGAGSSDPGDPFMAGWSASWIVLEAMKAKHAPDLTVLRIFSELNAVHGSVARVFRDDAKAIESGATLRSISLWPAGYVGKREEAPGRLWSNDPETWDFWRRWWQGARSGKSIDWELQKRIALIPSVDWERNDPAHIAGLIREIESEWRAEQRWADDDDRLALALSRTDNAERIEVNPDTGRLRLVPTSALPPDIAVLARANIGASLELFGPLLRNQYSALAPALSRLRHVLDQAADLPMVLHDACSFSIRLTQHQVRLQEIPDPTRDPLVTEFIHILRQTCLDIASHDPRTREVLARRNEASDAAAFIEASEAILPLISPVAENSEGELAVALPLDALTMADPNAAPETRRESRYRIVGRMLRVARAIRNGLISIGGIASGIEAIGGILAWVAQHQTWKVFYKALNSWLGQG